MILKFKSRNNEFKKGLYLVSTPIGNLGDVSYRAVEILKNSDYILCEDTRVSQKLLNKYKIEKKLIPYHKFNEKKNLEKVREMLRLGSIISLISDAGTPGISDPGKILINECVRTGIDIFPIPGPSAVSSSISISGFSEKFFFYGFLPEKTKILDKDLDIISKLDCSIVFFLSAKKVGRTIPYLKKYFTNRKILICREMTKLYEEYIRTNINELSSLSFTPKVSHANFVNCNFSSGSSTLPVKKILPSRTLVLIETRYFLSFKIILVDILFSIIESSIWVPTDLGSNATLTPVPKKPFVPTPVHPFNNKKNNIEDKILIFIFNFQTISINFFF